VDPEEEDWEVAAEAEVVEERDEEVDEAGESEGEEDNEEDMITASVCFM
jgi:hypothetical protein